MKLGLSFLFDANNNRENYKPSLHIDNFENDNLLYVS